MGFNNIDFSVGRKVINVKGFLGYYFDIIMCFCLFFKCFKKFFGEF